MHPTHGLTGQVGQEKAQKKPRLTNRPVVRPQLVRLMGVAHAAQ